MNEVNGELIKVSYQLLWTQTFRVNLLQIAKTFVSSNVNPK